MTPQVVRIESSLIEFGDSDSIQILIRLAQTLTASILALQVALPLLELMSTIKMSKCNWSSDMVSAQPSARFEPMSLLPLS